VPEKKAAMKRVADVLRTDASGRVVEPDIVARASLNGRMLIT